MKKMTVTKDNRTAADAERRRLMRQNPCRICGAKEGNPCLGADGEPWDVAIHAGRLKMVLLHPDGTCEPLVGEVNAMTDAELIASVPGVTDSTMAYPCGRLFEQEYDRLTTLAKERPCEWGEKVASDLFFCGGNFPPKRDDISQGDYLRLLRWMHAGLRSSYPHHDDKMSVCGMLIGLVCQKPG